MEEEKKEIKVGLKTTVFCIVLFMALIVGMVWNAIYKYYNPTVTEKTSVSSRVVGVREKNY